MPPAIACRGDPAGVEHLSDVPKRRCASALGLADDREHVGCVLAGPSVRSPGGEDQVGEVIEAADGIDAATDVRQPHALSRCEKTGRAQRAVFRTAPVERPISKRRLDGRPSRSRANFRNFLATETEELLRSRSIGTNGTWDACQDRNLRFAARLEPSRRHLKKN